MARRLFLAMLASGLLLACEDEKAPQTAGPSVALLVDGVPVYHEDVERLARFLTAHFYNLNFEEAMTIVLVNSLLPRAAALSHFADRVEPLQRKIEALRQRILDGEDFDDVGNEASDFPVAADDPTDEWASLRKLDFLLGEWLFSLEPEKVSQPILTRHGWHLLKVLERNDPPVPTQRLGRFHAIVLAFDRDPGLDERIRQWVEKAEIRIMDPKYAEILPEWVKYRPGARKYNPLELPGNPEKSGK